MKEGGRLQRTKAFIKANCPTSFVRFWQVLCHGQKPMVVVFTGSYKKRLAQGQGSLSGPGSTLLTTWVVRQELPLLLQRINARSLLDAPCGDFHWMKETTLDLDRYIGADIVPDLISLNQERYSNPKREFLTLNIAKDDLPTVDLIFCRDCLVHLSFSDAIAALRNFKRSGSRNLLTTTFPGVIRNRDIITGDWRPINLERRPFGLPKPIELIEEKSVEGGSQYSDKALGLWQLKDFAF
jgi:hypothetical protein